MATPAAAESRASLWLRERLILEWLVGAGGWRAALGGDSLRPGFSSFAGGTELTLGLDVVGPLGIVVDGRFLAGSESGGTYYEATGALGVQIRVASRVRLRLCGVGGQVQLVNNSATVAGGFLAGSFTLFELGRSLVTVLGARLDLDALLGAQRPLPGQSLAFSLGLGFYY